VSGVPTPRVVWTRDGQPIDVGRNRRFELRDAGRQLVIHLVSVTDSGTYRCVASNAAGHDSVDIALNVHGTSTMTG